MSTSGDVLQSIRGVLARPESPLDSAIDGARIDFRQRSKLAELDNRLHDNWNLGRNLILGWCPHDSGILVLVVPHYAVADYTMVRRSGDTNGVTSESEAFVTHLLSGKRQFSHHQLQTAAKLLNTEPEYIPLRSALTGTPEEVSVIEHLVRRYGVSYVPSRAVALFDIVGFSLLSPFEQMTQLNSLAYSLNSAHSKMLDRHLYINFARSGTGDGFYIWNRDAGVEANTNLYHFMHLVLADNAIARRKAHGRTVPLLRVGFHVGGCYEFHQAEGLNPTIYGDIVGDVTIELARMIERALPGQIFVGEFEATFPISGVDSDERVTLDSIDFVDCAQGNLSQLNGLVLSGEAIESIKCYLTGRPCDDGGFTVRKLMIDDKHGLSRNVFNAKINIYRTAAEPILLGIEDKRLRGGTLDQVTVEHIMPGSRQ